MVDAAVTFAIERLSDFLTKEINIRLEVKNGVKWLKDELIFLRLTVKEAEEINPTGIIRQWIDNVKDVAEEAVTILDKFTSLQQEPAASKQGVQDCVRSYICMCEKEASLHDIGKDINSLKVRVLEVKNRRDEFKIDQNLGTLRETERQKTLQRPTSLKNKEEVVGLDKDVQTLLTELEKPDLSLRVISIHGMGGLGKTTLARELYHSSKLSHFKSRAWVSVNKNYTIEDVLKRLIKSFLRHQREHVPDWANMDDDDLLHQLLELLDRGKYLVVIDDIWDTDLWGKISVAFPSNNGGRVIITTRNKKVALRINDRCFIHQLGLLGKDDSWQLFCNIAEQSGNLDKLGIQRANNMERLEIQRDKPTTNLEKLGKEMISKCGGLPLAMVELTRLLLQNNYVYEEWSKVKDHIWRRLKDNSVKIKDILRLSFEELSFPQRDCFLYLARFPQDHTLRADELMRLWVAEEFIPENEVGDHEVMEDVAEKYLNELINRNMIQMDTLQMNGQVVQCRVHDLVRDIAIEKARETKLLGIFDSNKQDPSSSQLLHRQPRRAIYNGISKYLELLVCSDDDSKLRSLALINETRFDEINLICNRFENLKVLDLCHVISDRIPKEIGDLILLKFLGLMGGSEQSIEIPSTVGKLKNLQTLCGSHSSEYKIPEEIGMLNELRHLYFGYFPLKSVAGGGLKIGSNQAKLQTLGKIWYKDWIHIDTRHLINLRVLYIRDASVEGSVYNLKSMGNLTSLQALSLKFHANAIPTIKPLSSCKRLNRVALFGTMNDPSGLSVLPDSVTELTLSSSDFTQDPMPILGNLPSLTALQLDKAYRGKKMVCGVHAFPRLKFLKLKVLPNLEEMQLKHGALPSVEGIDLIGCDKLKVVSWIGVPPIPQMYRFWDFDS